MSLRILHCGLMKGFLNIQIVWILLPGLVLLGCHWKDSDDSVLARVGDAKLTFDQLKHYDPQGLMTPEQQRQWVKEWVNREVLYQDAMALGLAEKPEVAWSLQSARQKILSQAYLNHMELQLEDPEEGELEAWYQRNGSSYLRAADEYFLSDIRFSSGKTAWQQVSDRVQFKFTPWPDTLYDSSDSSQITILPYRTLDRIDSCFHEKLPKLKVGRYSLPVRCQDDYRMIRLDSLRLEGSRLSYAEARPQILQAVRMQDRRKLRDSLLNQSKVRYPVFTWVEHLKKSKDEE